MCPFWAVAKVSSVYVHENELKCDLQLGKGLVAPETGTLSELGLPLTSVGGEDGGPFPLRFDAYSGSIEISPWSEADHGCAIWSCVSAGLGGGDKPGTGAGR